MPTRTRATAMFVAEAWVTTPSGWPSTSGRTSCTRRSTSTSSATPWDAGRAARRPSTSASPRPRPSGRRPPGCCPTTTSPATRPATRDSTPPAAVSRRATGSGPTPRSTPRSACAGPGPRRCSMLALPGSAYVYQGEELGLPDVVDLPEDVLADPIWERSGHTERGRDGCRVPIPWTARRTVARVRQRRALAAAAADLRRASRCRREQGVEGSTLELYRRRCAAGGASRSRPASTGCRRPAGSLAFRRKADGDGRALVCVVALHG